MSYKDYYGHSYRKQKPDLTKCCEQVVSYETRWPEFHQCQRKRGFGPSQEYCKQHSPDEVKARNDKQTAKYEKHRKEESYKWYGKTFYEALVKIAEGHNDARAVAQEAIAKFKHE